MIRVAIVEDEKKYADKMVEYVKRFQEENPGETFLVSQFDNAVDFLSDYDPDTDIVFIDIEMPLMNGYEAAQRLRRDGNNVCLIFVTCMAQYAVKGYEVDAIDFMVKPVGYYNFSLKLKKAIGIARHNKRRSIAVMSDNVIKTVAVSDIYYIEVIKHDTYIHTKSGVLRQQVSLKEMETKLGGRQFARCNHCYLVNLAYVTSVSGNSVVVGQEELQMSRPKRKAFIDALTAYLNGGCVI